MFSPLTEKYFFKWRYEEMSPTSLVFDKIKVKIKFRDQENKKKDISAQCKVTLYKNAMRIISRKLLKEQELGQAGEASKLTEESLPSIYNMAKDLNVPWWHLMNIGFSPENVLTSKYKYKYRGPASTKNLRFEVAGKTGLMMVEMEKVEGWSSSPSEPLQKISLWIKKYGADSSSEDHASSNDQVGK